MVKPILTSHHQIRLLDACPPPVARNGAAAARPGRPVRLCPLERPTARAPSRSGEPKIGLVLSSQAVGLACPNYAAGGSPRQQLAELPPRPWPQTRRIMRRRIFSAICSSRGETAIDALATRAAATNANAQLVQLKIRGTDMEDCTRVFGVCCLTFS
jgi:hypothetical protein